MEASSNYQSKLKHPALQYMCGQCSYLLSPIISYDAASDCTIVLYNQSNSLTVRAACSKSVIAGTQWIALPLTPALCLNKARNTLECRR